ncbi:hypothetical protein RclHR1_10260008 [Rhizophagus clarus]|nr:hypothetical protein RclHR1_10260008 [Rhizophagus clarus]
MIHFHVTNIDQRGVNTVYESQRSKSYFFDLDPLNHHEFTFYRNPTPFLRIITNDKKASLTESVYQSTSKYLNKKFKVSLLLTHFFKLQKVIPKRIQHKYFTFLRDSLHKRLSIIESRYNSTHTNNCSTRTFIRFTYKKYRFILGIFIPCCYPCGFLSSSPDLKENNCCTLPTPIVYSRYNNFCRVGCGLHNKLVPKYSKPSNTTTIIPSAQRIAALTNIHQKWSSQSTNYIYSTRRGISYCTKISVPSDGIVYSRWNFFYTKNYNSYQLIYRTQNVSNFTSRTLEKQAQRRQRSERRVLNSHKSTVPDNPNQPIRTPTKKFLFTKHKTLCDSVRYFTRHVNHLKEGIHDKRPHLAQYLPIPKAVPVVTDKRITRANQDQIEYIPLPENVRLSMSHDDYMKYKDFILTKPVFLGKGKRRFALTPGSDKWWQWVKDRYRNHQEELEKAHVRPCFPDWNTTYDRYRHRLDNLIYLMEITDTTHHHYAFSNFNKTLRQLDRKSKKTITWRRLEHWRLLTDQTLDGDSYPGCSARHFDTLKPTPDEHDHAYDPDEFRLKRPYHSPLYIDHHYHLVRTSKRPCFNFDHVITK